MKLIFSYFLIMLVGLNIKAEQPNCCATQMSDFTSDNKFLLAHLNPAIFEGENTLGTMINPKDCPSYYEIKSNNSNKYLFVFHEWWGLTEQVKKEAEELYKSLDGKVNVLAIDMYDGRVAKDRETAAKYMSELSTDKASVKLNQILNHLPNNIEIGTIGWCMGGGLSFEASLYANSKAKACVIYYGLPTKDLARIEKLNCNTLGIFATEDKWISPEVVKEFEENMKKAHKKLEVLNYKADHAFANPSNPQYNIEFKNDALNKVVIFFKKELGL